MLLQTLRAPPKVGSLLESVLVLMLMKQENIEHARFRALAQILINKESGVEAFEEYMKVAFPYLEATKRKQSEAVAHMIDQEIKRGPIVVRPQQTTVVKSKMRNTISNREKGQTRDQADALYKKMGGSIPI
jgi:hypothetical protein